MLAKKYLTLRFDTGGAPGSTLAGKYKCGNYSVLLLTPAGEVAARFTNHPTPAQIADGIVGIPEMTAGEELLAQLKEKGITKANAEAVAGALKRIGTVPSPKAQETILGFLKDESVPEAVHRGAILALGKQPAAAKDVVPFLTDKRAPFKSAAQTTLIAMGVPGLPAVLEGLESDSADVRTAAFYPAATVTRNAKLARDQTFWKTGKADDRAKAIQEWKDWVDGQLKPKPKDLPLPKGKEPTKKK